MNLTEGLPEHLKTGQTSYSLNTLLAIQKLVDMLGYKTGKGYKSKVPQVDPEKDVSDEDKEDDGDGAAIANPVGKRAQADLDESESETARSDEEVMEQQMIDITEAILDPNTIEESRRDIERITSSTQTEEVEQPKRQVQGQLRTLKIDLRVTPAPSNAQYAGRISARSSTVNPVYTEQNITFKNIGYVRQYVIINNPVLSVPFIFNDKAPERHINWKVYEKVLQRGPWNKSNSSFWNGKLSDIKKIDNIQHVTFVARPVAQSYDDAEIGKEYSGYHWNTYKYHII